MGNKRKIYTANVLKFSVKRLSLNMDNIPINQQ